MSSLLSRKKGSKSPTPEDPEQGKASVSYAANGGNRFSSKLTRLINRLKLITLYEVNISLFVVVLVLFTLLIIAPAHVKKKRNAVLNQQMNEITTAINAQKESLNQKYEYLQKAINSDNDQLVSDLYEMIGLVKKDHHDEEVKEKESTIKNLSADARTTVNKKQYEIDRLKAEILKNKSELERVKSVMEDIDVKPEHFCDDCTMESQPGVTCKARREFLKSRYGTPDQEGRNVVVKQDASCFKKVV